MSIIYLVLIRKKKRNTQIICEEIEDINFRNW